MAPIQLSKEVNRGKIDRQSGKKRDTNGNKGRRRRVKYTRKGCTRRGQEGGHRKSNRDNNKNTKPITKTQAWQQERPWCHRAVMNNQLHRPELFFACFFFLLVRVSRLSRMQINIHFNVRIFESRISNGEVTFPARRCRATAAGMCLKSRWREPGNCEPLSPFSPPAVVRGTAERVLRLWEALYHSL